MRRVLRAALVAAAVSGAPSTVHALRTGRDPGEAAYAAGTLLLPREQQPGRLLAAAVPVHFGLALAWTLVLDRALPRDLVAQSHKVLSGAAAGLAIAAVDLGVVGRRVPRIRALPLVPQLADHALFGAVAARLLR